MPLAQDVEPFYKELGNRIARCRFACHMSQADLGAKLTPPVTRASIANIENGHQRVLAHTLVQLAQALGVRVIELTTDEEPPLIDPPPSTEQMRKELYDEIRIKLPDWSEEQARRIVDEVVITRDNGTGNQPTRIA